ncbi:MAG: trk system potassium uptake protein TrkA [Myxococcota bacterium]|jgi:trk system potassium uptake protein TrkA
MNIAIAGAGEVATHVAELLLKRHAVSLIVPEGLQTTRLDLIDAQIVRGSATSSTILSAAGVAGCGVFVAATDSDEANLVACVLAARLGAGRTLCLLNNPTDQHTLDVNLAETLGIHALIRPAEQLAEEMIRIVSVPGALDAQHFEGGRVRLLRHLVENGAPLISGPLHSLSLPNNAVLVLGKRGQEAFIPNGASEFQAGDTVTVMGTPRGVHEVLYRFLRSSDHGYDAQDVLIVGGGSVGLSVAQGLESAGWTVKIVEADRDRCEVIAPLIRGLVIHGDGTDLDLLEQEHAEDTAVLLALTSGDQDNLLVSLIGKTLGIPRIITRADRLSNERLFERVGIDVVRSARGAAIRRVTHDIVENRFEIKAELDHGDVHIVDIKLPKDFPPTTLAAMATPLFAVVGALVRGDKIIIPRGDTTLYADDHLLIVTSTDCEDEARVHFASPHAAEAE